MTVNIATIEKTVVKRLKTALPTVHVEAFPADARQFLEKYRFVQGCLLVQFIESRNNYVSRRRGTRVVTLEVSAISKDLREHTGIYDLLDAASATISGVLLSEVFSQSTVHSEPLEEEKPGIVFLLQTQEFTTYLEKNGLWVYTQRYESEPFGFIYDEDETAVQITRLSIKVSNDIEATIPELP